MNGLPDEGSTENLDASAVPINVNVDKQHFLHKPVRAVEEERGAVDRAADDCLVARDKLRPTGSSTAKLESTAVCDDDSAVEYPLSWWEEYLEPYASANTRALVNFTMSIRSHQNRKEFNSLCGSNTRV